MERGGSGQKPRYGKYGATTGPFETGVTDVQESKGVGGGVVDDA